MGKKYQRRVSDLIRSHLTELLTRKINDPRLEMITITDITVTPDARYAEVYFSVLGSPEMQADAQAGLESAASWLRRELGQRLHLRNTPALTFHYDPSLERGEHIVGLLDQLKEQSQSGESRDAETG